MKNLVISPSVMQKLGERHGVTRDEIEECFMNRMNTTLLDPREEHRSDPPTEWFIGETDVGRKLKVIFIPRDGAIILRSAYEPDTKAEAIYTRLSKPDPDLR